MPLRRVAVHQLTVMFEVSQLRVCAVVGQPRLMQRLPPARVPDAEQDLRARLRDLAAKHPRYRCGRLQVLLAREGCRVNHMRVQRLCRDECLMLELRASR